MGANMNLTHVEPNSFSVGPPPSEGWNVNIFQPAALYLKAFISCMVEKSNPVFWQRKPTPHGKSDIFPYDESPKRTSTPGNDHFLTLKILGFCLKKKKENLGLTLLKTFFTKVSILADIIKPYLLYKTLCITLIKLLIR